MLGTLVGASEVGSAEGIEDGSHEGQDGTTVGMELVGVNVGSAEGAEEGSPEGKEDGTNDGLELVGVEEGSAEGIEVGSLEGEEGSPVGSEVGDRGAAPITPDVIMVRRST